MSTLGAQYGETRGEIDIQGNQGFVESSNDDPFDGRPEAPARDLGLGLLSLAALGLVRRRRQR